MKSDQALETPELLRALSREGAMGILREAENGFESGKETIRQLGLGQKAYYSRLGDLRRLGLIRKDGINKYIITQKGTIAVNVQKRLANALHGDGSLLPMESRVMVTYQEMMNTLSQRIDAAKSRLKLATRYIDTTIAKKTFDAMDRNVSIEIVYKKGRQHLGPMALELLGMVKNDIASRARELRKMTRISDIPFSFAVIDGHWSGIELVAGDDTFVAAFEFEGEEAAKTLSWLFRHYYRVGTVFPRFQ